MSSLEASSKPVTPVQKLIVRDSISERRFKAGILACFLLLSLSAAYYFVIYLPGEGAAKETHLFKRSHPNSTAATLAASAALPTPEGNINQFVNDSFAANDQVNPGRTEMRDGYRMDDTGNGPQRNFVVESR